MEIKKNPFLFLEDLSVSVIFISFLTVIFRCHLQLKTTDVTFFRSFLINEKYWFFKRLFPFFLLGSKPFLAHAKSPGMKSRRQNHQGISTTSTFTSAELNEKNSSVVKPVLMEIALQNLPCQILNSQWYMHVFTSRIYPLLRADKSISPLLAVNH